MPDKRSRTGRDPWGAHERVQTRDAGAGPSDSPINETVAFLRHLDDTQDPDPHFVENLERLVLQRARTAHSVTSNRPTPIPPAAPTPPPSPSLLTRQRPAGVRGQSSAWRVPVAITLVTLLIAVPLSLSSRSTNRGADVPTTRPPTAIPAPINLVGVTVEAFGSVTFPVDLSAAPAIDWQVATETEVLQPGAEGSQPRSTAATGTGIELVLEGILTVTSDAPLRITHLDGSTVEATPGTPVTVGPGESIHHLDIAAAQSWRNPGARRAVVVGLSIFIIDLVQASLTGMFPNFGGIVGDSGSEERVDDWHSLGLPDGPVTAVFHRFTFRPGAALPPQPDREANLRWVETGVIGWAPVNDEIGTRPPHNPLARYFAGQRVPWITPEPNTLIMLNNPSDNEPAVLWEVLLLPAPTTDST